MQHDPLPRLNSRQNAASRPDHGFLSQEIRKGKTGQHKMARYSTGKTGSYLDTSPPPQRDVGYLCAWGFLAPQLIDRCLPRVYLVRRAARPGAQTGVGLLTSTSTLLQPPESCCSNCPIDRPSEKDVTTSRSACIYCICSQYFEALNEPQR